MYLQNGMHETAGAGSGSPPNASFNGIIGQVDCTSCIDCNLISILDNELLSLFYLSGNKNWSNYRFWSTCSSHQTEGTSVCVHSTCIGILSGLQLILYSKTTNTFLTTFSFHRYIFPSFCESQCS